MDSFFFLADLLEHQLREDAAVHEPHLLCANHAAASAVHSGATSNRSDDSAPAIAVLLSAAASELAKAAATHELQSELSGVITSLTDHFPSARTDPASKADSTMENAGISSFLFARTEKQQAMARPQAMAAKQALQLTTGTVLRQRTTPVRRDNKENRAPQQRTPLGQRSTPPLLPAAIVAAIAGTPVRSVKPTASKLAPAIPAAVADTPFTLATMKQLSLARRTSNAMLRSVLSPCQSLSEWRTVDGADTLSMYAFDTELDLPQLTPFEDSAAAAAPVEPLPAASAAVIVAQGHPALDVTARKHRGGITARAAQR